MGTLQYSEELDRIANSVSLETTDIARVIEILSELARGNDQPALKMILARMRLSMAIERGEQWQTK